MRTGTEGGRREAEEGVRVTLFLHPEGKEEEEEVTPQQQTNNTTFHHTLRAALANPNPVTAQTVGPCRAPALRG